MRCRGSITETRTAKPSAKTTPRLLRPGSIERVTCARCNDTRWVCENHSDRPWEGERACTCGGAGEPCPDCNKTEPPRMPQGFKIDADKKGWRNWLTR